MTATERATTATGRTMTTKRIVGLDVARVVAMFGIIGYHVLKGGGVRDTAEPWQASYWVAWYLYLLCVAAVDLFALLSGYLGYTKKFYGSYRLIELIFTLFFWCALITCVLRVATPWHYTSWWDYAVSLCPPIITRYWYIVCYLPVFLLMPYINLLLHRLTLRQADTFCLMLVTVFSVIPSFTAHDLFRQNIGFSAGWLVVCYIVGATTRRREIEEAQGGVRLAGADAQLAGADTASDAERQDKTDAHLPARLWAGVRDFRLNGVVLFFVLALVLLGIKWVCITVRDDDWISIRSYSSPFMLAMAYVLLQTLRRSFGHAPVWLGRLMAFMADAAFDVYIIHAHVFIYSVLMHGAFWWVVNLPLPVIPLFVLGLATAIYLSCAVLAQIRMRVCGTRPVRRLIGRVSGWLDSWMCPPEWLPARKG